jgi:ribosomal protein S18 acetylase RimI-like enzyme
LALLANGDCRSQGLGQLLLTHVQNLAKEIGCKRVCVHTRNTNEAAKKFYLEHAGYEKYASVFHFEV